TATVSSGHGVHLYWKLNEPYLIDDVGAPHPVRWEKPVDEGAKGHYYYVDSEGATVYSPFKLSGKAKYIRKVLAGIAEKIRGDKTIDLSRLLRLPETLNRKNQRNGTQPVACFLADCDPTRRYSIEQFPALTRKPAKNGAAKKSANVRDYGLDSSDSIEAEDVTPDSGTNDQNRAGRSETAGT